MGGNFVSVEKKKDKEKAVSMIPEEHRELVEVLGWDEDEYLAKIRVLDRDGVTLEQLAEWKSKYGDVYRESFGGKVFYYRPIQRQEHTEQVMNTQTTYTERDEIIATRCTLHAAEYEFTSGPAGMASRVMELSLDHSGFVTDGPAIVF